MQQKYKNLFAEIIWPSGPTTVQFASDVVPAADLVSNINAVPYIGIDQWVVIQLDNGLYEIPGGTVEPGEKPLAALARELREEAGAQLLSVAYIGAWQMHSLAAHPFRPHLPHPLAYRVVYLCQVELTSQPQIPEANGEKVVAVNVLSLETAVRCFEEIDRHDLADLFRLAAERCNAQ